MATATVTSYNICFCSESESGSGVSDAIEEPPTGKTLQKQNNNKKKKEVDDTTKKTTTTAMALNGGSLANGPDEAGRKDRIWQIKKKYLAADAKFEHIQAGNSAQPLAVDGLRTRDDGDQKQKVFVGFSEATAAGEDKIRKIRSKVKQSSGDSDTMQEEGEVSSTTIQELDQAWDVYQEPLYATGSDVTDEERLDPSSLIEDWDGSMEEMVVPENVLLKGRIDWSEDSDTEDIGRLIEDSRMQLKIIRGVIDELMSNYTEVSRSDYIESFATCQTNIRCLENLLAALNRSMGDKQTDNEHVTSLLDLLNSWQTTYKELEGIERPKQLGQKNKVRKRLRKKKIFRKFSCYARGEDGEGREERACALLNHRLSADGRSGSLPDVEFGGGSLAAAEVEEEEEEEEEGRGGGSDGSRRKLLFPAGEVDSSRKIEGDTKLMGSLFFGLVALVVVVKMVHCYFGGEAGDFSLDVSFFVDYLRERPPA